MNDSRNQTTKTWHYGNIVVIDEDSYGQHTGETNSPSIGYQYFERTKPNSVKEGKEMFEFCLHDFGFIKYLSKYNEQRERSISGSLAKKRQHSVRVPDQTHKKPQYKLRAMPRAWDRNLPAIRAEQRNSTI